MDSDNEDGGGVDLFAEPQDFYKPEAEATFASHTLLDGRELKVRLVGHNPLWGHHLWNAGRTIATYLEKHADRLVADKTVLELGAGAGLPSLTCALKGARKVVVTDYPDAELVENLKFNVEALVKDFGVAEGILEAEGYLWGASPTPLLSLLPQSHPSPVSSSSSSQGYDVLILADLLFNHSEHAKLLLSIQRLLSPSPSSRALVFFTPYRPWLLQKDLAFFDAARDQGFVVEKVLEHVMDKVMFEEDPGDEMLRRTVFGFEVRRASDKSA